MNEPSRSTCQCVGQRTLWLAQEYRAPLVARKLIAGKRDGKKTMMYLPSVEAYVASLPDRVSWLRDRWAGGGLSSPPVP